MSKYKPGDKFVVEIKSDCGNGWYGIKGFEDLIFPETSLDKMNRLLPTPADEESGLCGEKFTYKPYRTWQQLVAEPDDMTQDEKERLKRIRSIPTVAFDASNKYAGYLREQIVKLEAELDRLCDFLNGEI